MHYICTDFMCLFICIQWLQVVNLCNLFSTLVYGEKKLDESSSLLVVCFVSYCVYVHSLRNGRDLMLFSD
jgi:hypothetical protein